MGLMSSINLGKRCIMLAMVGETEHDRTVSLFCDVSLCRDMVVLHAERVRILW